MPRKFTSAAALLAGVLALTGCHGGSRPIAQAPASAPAGAPPSAAAPRIGTTIDGTLLYLKEGESDQLRLVLLEAAEADTVLTGLAAFSAELSPDGKRIAYVKEKVGTGAGDLYVADVDGRNPRKLRSKVITPGFGPTWSPDSARLVIAVGDDPEAYQRGTITVADRTFTPLPGSLQNDIRYRLTGDGTKFVFSDGECRILMSDVDGRRITRVPVLGDEDSSTNPRRQRACDIISVNHDGSRASVDLVVGDGTNGDIGGSASADAIVDTATGKVLPLPVDGTVTQALYLTDGRLLVSSGTDRAQMLYLLSPDGNVTARMPAPARAEGLHLHDFAG